MTLSLLTRTPPLINLPGFAFNENMPLRNLPPLIDTVPGASAIQQQIEWSEWATESGNPAAYAVASPRAATGRHAGEAGDPPVRTR